MIGLVGNNNASGGIVSANNNRTTIIPNGETWSGSAELNSYAGIMVQVTTDQDGTLYIEFSPDGNNWDTSISIPYDASAINTPQPYYKLQRYFRIRFTNTSGSDQTYFRLHTYCGAVGQLTSSISGTVSKSFPANLVRPTDYFSEVAMGKRQGRTTVNKWGINEDVDTASPEIVASFGGAWSPLTHVITTAQTFTITYNNTTDGLGQTGALTLLITYLDANFYSQQAIHTLSNTGSDVTTFTGLGINRAVVLSNGGAGWNVNNITFTATTDGTTQAQIPALRSVTQQVLYHTQINHTLLTDWLFLNALKDSGGGNPKVTFNMYSWSRVTLTRYLVFTYKLDTSINDGLELNPSQKFPFGGREVIWIEATTSANDTSVAARFSGIEEQVT